MRAAKQCIALTFTVALTSCTHVVHQPPPFSGFGLDPERVKVNSFCVRSMSIETLYDWVEMSTEERSSTGFDSNLTANEYIAQLQQECWIMRQEAAHEGILPYCEKYQEPLQRNHLGKDMLGCVLGTSHGSLP